MGVQQQLAKPHQALLLHQSSPHSTRSSRSTCTNQSTNNTRSTHKEHTQGAHARSTHKEHTLHKPHKPHTMHTPHAHAARTPQHTAAHHSTPNAGATHHTGVMLRRTADLKASCRYAWKSARDTSAGMDTTAATRAWFASGVGTGVAVGVGALPVDEEGVHNGQANGVEREGMGVQRGRGI